MAIRVQDDSGLFSPAEVADLQFAARNWPFDVIRLAAVMAVLE